jgi:hypothetical protein
MPFPKRVNIHAIEYGPLATPADGKKWTRDLMAGVEKQNANVFTVFDDVMSILPPVTMT